MRDLNLHEMDDHSSKTQREYRDGNMTWWRQRLKDRFGVTIPEPKEEGDSVGSSLRLRSPDHHYHYPNSSFLTTAAAVLTGGALAIGGLLLADYLKDKPADTKPVTTDEGNPVGLNPGGLKIEVVKDPQVGQPP